MMDEFSGITKLVKEFFNDPFAGLTTLESQQAVIILATTFLFGLWTAYLSWGLKNRRLRKKINQLEQERQDYKTQITNLNTELVATKTELETSNSYILENQNIVGDLEESKAFIQAQLNSTQAELLEIRNEKEILQKEHESLIAQNESLTLENSQKNDASLEESSTSFEERLLEMEQRINQLEREKAVLNKEVSTLGNRPHHVSIDDESVIVNRRRPKLIHPKQDEILNLQTIIPVATTKRKDNLKGINGIGPFLEEQLNGIGIFTYEQISKLDSKTIDKITEAIEYIPGRIEKDDWVGQANKILKNRKSRSVSKSFNLIMADDLKVIEGIGPKIEEVLKKGRIRDLADLSNASLERINKILASAGGRFKIANPETWASQAKIAVTGDWDALKRYQDTLKGGRVVS